MRTPVFFRWPVLVLLAGLCPLPSASWNTVHSKLFIEPGKQFVLGGGQRAAFRVAARNAGKVAIGVKERPAQSVMSSKATLGPGQRAVLRFAAGSAAVFVNSAATTTTLDLRITGESGLGMSTESNCL